MNVCLVNPTPKKIIEFHGVGIPHIGLGYLAGYLRRNMKNIDLLVIDGKYENLNQKDLIDKIESVKPDFLGITSFTQEIYDAAFIARAMKSLNKNLITCIGGVHVHGVKEQVLEEFEEFDYAILGEGEITLYNLLEEIQQGRIPQKINGVIYRDTKGSVVPSPPADLVMDLDSLPMPDWSFALNAKAFPIMSARGCPFRCVFCMRPYGNITRMRSPQKVVEEIEYVHTTYKNDHFIFYDESLGAVKGKFMEIIDGIIDRGLNKKLTFDGHTHVNLVSPQLFLKMKIAGFTSIGFGVESGNDDILKNIGKSITTEKVSNAVNMAKEAGLQTSAYFILGLPNETYRTALKTISFAKKLNTDSISIGIMIPFPNTKVSEMVYKGENGYVKPNRKIKWDEFNKQNENPLRYKYVNYKVLRLIQIFGYIYHTMANFRIKFLIRRGMRQRNQILLMFKNLFKAK
jgi:radical SAM superfamily enzyme YgiQ (UPF0313 family)